MREDDYTGSLIDSDDPTDALLQELEDAGLHELDDDEYRTLIYGDDDDEVVLNITSAADGAKSLREAAEMLYDFADELAAMSAEGWEIVDDITNGHATAVRFGLDGEEGQS